MPIVRTLYLREPGCEGRNYFPKPKGAREQKSLGNIAISHLSLLSVNVQLSFVAPDGAVMYRKYVWEFAQRTRLIAAAVNSGHATVYCLLTHWGRVTQICVFTLQLCKTD